MFITTENIWKFLEMEIQWSEIVRRKVNITMNRRDGLERGGANTKLIGLLIILLICIIIIWNWEFNMNGAMWGNFQVLDGMSLFLGQRFVYRRMCVVSVVRFCWFHLWIKYVRYGQVLYFNWNRNWSWNEIVSMGI